MTASASKVAVFNRALSGIGVDKGLLDDGEEATVAGEQFRLIFDDCLRAILERKPWPWAIATQVLAEIDEQEQSGTGTGAQTRFDIDVAFRESSQISVEVDGVEQELETDYSVTPPEPGAKGYVTFVSAPDALAEIVITVTTTRQGWDHVYAAPSDMVKPLGLVFEDSRLRDLPISARGEWQLRRNDAGNGWLICTDYGSEDFDGFEYVALTEDVQAWPREAVDALVARLEAELMASMKKDRAAKERMLAAGGEVDLAIARAWSTSGDMDGDKLEPMTPSAVARGAGGIFDTSDPRWRSR